MNGKFYNNKKVITYFLITIIKLILIASSLYSQSGWIQQTTGMRDNVSINFINSNSGYITGSDGTILKTTNLGLNWNVISSYSFGAPLI